MAQESYRSPALPDQPGYYEYPPPAQGAYATGYPPNYTPQQPSDSERMRHRASSTAYGDGYAQEARLQQAQQPINEAVTSAFDKANTSSHIPPELISQITQNVIQQLKATNLDPPLSPIHQTQSFPQTHSSVPPAPVAGSFSNHSGSPPFMPNRHDVYTPPSPHRPDEAIADTPPSQPKYPPPPHESPPDIHIPLPNERRTNSPFSQTSDSGLKDIRPRAPPRLFTGNEETTLEKIWGQLFGLDGKPTRRLGQFLRGIAIHLIEDYEPVQSLVITPSKMQKFYEDTKLPNETYPWDLVFDDHTSSISRLYRDIECQHHLIQENGRFVERPDIPGLTPIGFEKWATLLIQAHPDAEFERLRKAVLDMPISNPDDKKERFPKEISRRLFPMGQDHQVKDRLERAMGTHCGIDMSKSPNLDPTSASQMHPRTDPNPNDTSSSVPAPPPGMPPPMASSIERERQPYSGIPSEAVVDGPPPSQPIERERKPYSAQPGGGKNFDDGTKPGTARLGRSDSMAARARPIPINVAAQRPTHDLPIPEPSHHRPSSIVNPPTSARRHRSPSINAGGDFRRSEGDIFGNNYGGSYASSGRAEPLEEESRRYYREGSIRDDGRGYDSNQERGRYDRANEHGGMPRASYANDDDYYRATGRTPGNGYDYNQPYPPSYR